MKAHGDAFEPTIQRCSYPDVEHSSGLGRPSCFRGCFPIIFYLRYRLNLVEYAPLVFHCPKHFRHSTGVILASVH